MGQVNLRALLTHFAFMTYVIIILLTLNMNSYEKTSFYSFQ